MKKIEEWQRKWNKHIQQRKLKELLLYPKEITELLESVTFLSASKQKGKNGIVFCKIKEKDFQIESEMYKKTRMYSKLVYKGLINEGQKIIDQLFNDFPFEKMITEIVEETYKEEYKDVTIVDISITKHGMVCLKLSNGETFYQK
jgi:hypothetical protein